MNDYRRSLDAFHEMYAESMRISRLRDVPLGDMISLILSIRNNWHLMYTRSQREWCTTMVREMGGNNSTAKKVLKRLLDPENAPYESHPDNETLEELAKYVEELEVSGNLG